MSSTHKERLEALNTAQEKDILNVADSLGMNLIKQGRSYIWSEHDSFVITPYKNLFYWNSRQVGGGSIQLVQLIKECSYKEAVAYLNETELKSFIETVTPKKEFNYYVKEAQDLTDTYNYLVNERQLSKETVDFFISQNIVAQGTYRDKENNHEETAIVFKHKDLAGNIKGMSFQGVKPYPAIHTGRGMLKRTYGDGFYGFHVAIGTPSLSSELSKDNPLKIIAFESPIDLMSYYELHSSKIDNAVLISMNGLRKGTLSTYLANYLGSNIAEDKKNLLLDDMEKISAGKTDVIEVVLSVDNDEAGKKFVTNFNTSFINVGSELPALELGQTKTDWNDILKKNKERVPSMDKEMNKENTPKNYLESLENSIDEVLNDMSLVGSESEQVYITKEEITGLLNSHLEKIEGLVSYYDQSIDLVDESNSIDNNMIKDGLLETVNSVSKDFKQDIDITATQKRPVIEIATQNISVLVEKIKESIRKNFSDRLLKINYSIDKIMTKIEANLGTDKYYSRTTDYQIKSEKNSSATIDRIEIGRQPVSLIENEKVITQEISNTIKDNPLADIGMLQEALIKNKNDIDVIKQKLETSSINLEKVDPIEKQINELEQQKELLMSECEELTKSPDFFAISTDSSLEISPIEKFSQLDKEIDNINGEIKSLKNKEILTSPKTKKTSQNTENKFEERLEQAKNTKENTSQKFENTKQESVSKSR